MALADRRYRPQFSWVLVSFALLVAWMFVADLFAVNPHKAFWSNYERMDGFVTLAHVFVLFLIAGPVLSATNLWRKWWMTLIGASALVSGYGVLQFMGATQIHQSATRLDATLGNSEYLAGFILLAIGITLWQAFESKNKTMRNALFALVAIQVFILFGTGTRGTFVALIGAAIFGGLMWLFEAGKSGGRVRKSVVAFLAAIVVFGGAFFALRNTSFVQNSPNLSRFAAISLADLDVRFVIWNMALEGAKERPVTGWGHEGYNYVFSKYFEPSLHGQEPWFDRAHSIYLDWLVAGGVPALALFLLLGLFAVIAVYRATQLKSWERVLILSTLVGYGIQGVVVFDNLFTYVPVALLLAYAHTLRQRPIAYLEKLPEMRGTVSVVTPVVGVAALAVIYFVNVPTYAAAHDLINGLTPTNTTETRLAAFEKALGRNPFATQEVREQLLMFSQQVAQSNAPTELKTKAVTLAADEIQKEIGRAPGDVRLYALFASFLRNVDEFEKARMVAAKARSLSPNKQTIMLEQGIIEWQAGKPEAARVYFAEAYNTATSSDELAIYLAAGYIISNDIPGGKGVLKDHFGTSTLNEMVLALAYQRVEAWGEVISILKQRYETLQDATTGYQLAIAYGRAGRFQEARALVLDVLSAHPDTRTQGEALLKQLGG